MPQQAGTVAFRGSDTDALDKIVNTINKIADFADKMVMTLRAICAALDAMSWTGYAAALSAYLKGVVIPLIQNVSRMLKLFAKVVSLASSVQKDASTNKWVVDAGDTGFVVEPISKGSPPAVEAPGAPGETAASSQTPGDVASNKLDTDKLAAAATNIADIVQKARDFAESADGDGVNDGKPSEQISKLAALVAAIEQFIADVKGDEAGGGDGSSGGDAGDGAGTDGSGDGSDTDGSGTDGSGTDGSGTDGSGTDGSGGSGDGRTFTAGQIWQAVTSALRELGILGPDGTIGPDGISDPGSTDGGAGAGSEDGSGAGFDRAAAAKDLDSIQSSLDSLRSTLGIEPTDSSADAQYGTGSPRVDAPSFDSPATPSSFDPGADASSSFPSSGADSAPANYQADTGTGTGSGSGGGSDSGGTSGSGGSDGSYQPATEQQAAQPARTEPTVYHAAMDRPLAVGERPMSGDGAQTRLVAMASQPTGSGGNAAVPLTGAALAASLLGGLYARRSRSEDESDSDGQAQEVYPAQPATT